MSTAIHRLTMPKWGLSMKEGTVIAWLVDEGGAVAAGDALVEIETEKVNNVVEAPVAGIVRRHVAGAGDTLPVGALLGVVAPGAVADAEIDAVVDAFAQTFVPAAADEEAARPLVADIDGRAISYRVAGDGDAVPLVLVHGFCGDTESWMFTQDALAAERPVIALDLPGHGASDKSVGDDGIGALVGAVAGLLDALAVERAHLAGHSLGGAVVAEVCAAAPARVASLTLIAPAGVGPTINGDAIRALALADRRRDARAALARMVADPDLVSRDMVEKFLRFKRTDAVAAAMAQLAGALAEGDRQRIDVSAALAAAACPILAIWGADDGVVPAGQAAGLPAAARVHRVAGAGHLPHMEAAGEVNQAIADFLRDGARRPGP